MDPTDLSLRTKPKQLSTSNLKSKVDLLGILTKSLCPLLQLVDTVLLAWCSWISGIDIRLVASDTTTPVSSHLLGLLEVVCLGGGNEVGESLGVLGSDISDGDSGGGLLACIVSAVLLSSKRKHTGN
jgi:hypothetical protein